MTFGVLAKYPRVEAICVVMLRDCEISFYLKEGKTLAPFAVAIEKNFLSSYLGENSLEIRKCMFY